VFTAGEVLRIQGVVRKVPVADSVVRYAVRLAASSRPGQAGTPDFVNEWINWGAGLRAGQALILAGKARALLQGRSHVTPDDVKALAVPVLRHRILPNFKAEAEGVDADQVVEKLLETVPVP
jgi:MoxR-like ATPase